MNEKYDFNSRKYMWLLMIICLLFFVVVMKAFQYLPANDRVNNYQERVSTGSNVEVIRSEEKAASEAAEEQKKQEAAIADEKYKKEHKSGRIIFKNSDISEIEEIEIPKSTLDEELPKVQEQTQVQTALTDDELALRAIINGKRNFKDKKYSEALSEYQKVAALTSDSELVAMSYEGISELYAISKRYGTALSFAAKAYNLSPSLAREMLIARIYYRAGNTENAVTRVNNLLKRDFAR